MSTPETDTLKAVVVWLKQFFVTRDEHEQNHAIERAQAKAMDLDTLIDSSTKHLDETRIRMNTIQDPTERNNLRQFILQAELWGDHLRRVRSDFAHLANTLISAPKK